MKEAESSENGRPDSRFELRYLFFATTVIAIGVALAGNEQLIPPVRFIGMGICCYWMAKGAFVLSARLPRVVREIVFLFALPLYLLCVTATLLGIMGTVKYLLEL